MKKSFHYLIDAIGILLMCIIVAICFGGIAWVSYPKDMVGVWAFGIMAVVILAGGVLLTWDIMRDYRYARNSERDPDQHEWPYRYNGIQL